jgi:hypothetical protein
MASRKGPQRRKTHQLNVPIPDEVWYRLRRGAHILDKTQATVVVAAITKYFDDLPPALRQLIDQAVALRDKL